MKLCWYVTTYYRYTIAETHSNPTRQCESLGRITLVSQVCDWFVKDGILFDIDCLGRVIFRPYGDDSSWHILQINSNRTKSYAYHERPTDPVDLPNESAVEEAGRTRLPEETAANADGKPKYDPAVTPMSKKRPTLSKNSFSIMTGEMKQPTHLTNLC